MGTGVSRAFGADHVDCRFAGRFTVGLAPLGDFRREGGAAAGADFLAAQVDDLVGRRVLLQGVELRAAGEVVDEGHTGLTLGGVGHARQDHVHAVGGQGVDHLLEAGFLPFDLHAQAFGQGIAQVNVEPGEGVGGRVLEVHRRVVRHDRYHDLTFFLDAGR
ncbi:hypothetical protein D3C80_1485510 [compost metagenome]